MQADGVISHYAIGGAVGATFYLEPAATLDLDVFVIPAYRSGTLITLGPIYEYLKSRGGIEDKEHIVLDGWPVQFLVPNNELEKEAIAASIPADVGGVKTWVMLPEHLVAIALATGRLKDHMRILQFIKDEAIDRVTLKAILEKHGLASKWKQFEDKYLEERS